MNMLIPDSNSYIPPAPDSGKKKRGFSFGKLVPFITIAVLSSLLVGGSILTIKYKPEILGLSKSGNPSQNDEQREIKNLITEVTKIMELPQETPVLATVTDLNKVQNQEFFARAKTGDKVLVYVNAKKAILYRPSEHKIIEVGRVNGTPDGQVAGDKTISVTTITPTPSETQPLVVEKSSLVGTPLTASPSSTLTPTEQ